MVIDVVPHVVHEIIDVLFLSKNLFHRSSSNQIVDHAVYDWVNHMVDHVVHDFIGLCHGLHFRPCGPPHGSPHCPILLIAVLHHVVYQIEDPLGQSRCFSGVDATHFDATFVQFSIQ